MADATVKTATGQSIGIGVGNALAYVLLEFLTYKYGWVPDDPAVFVVMVGTIMGAVTLQFIPRMVSGAKYIFDREVK